MARSSRVRRVRSRARGKIQDRGSRLGLGQSKGSRRISRPLRPDESPFDTSSCSERKARNEWRGLHRCIGGRNWRPYGEHAANRLMIFTGARRLCLSPVSPANLVSAVVKLHDKTPIFVHDTKYVWIKMPHSSISKNCAEVKHIF